MIRSPWAREYARTPNAYIWGTEAYSLARQVSARLPAAARVLDLGCGEGRDSVFFAECGFDVTGVDIARAGLSKAERLACGRGVRVHWVCGTIDSLEARRLMVGLFDLIYSCGAIHYVARARRARLLPAGAFATFNVVLVAWHLPPLYNLAMERHPVHIVEHLMIMAASVVLWWPMLSPLDELPRAPYPVQMLYLFVVGLPMVMVAIFISMADGLLYPYYAASPRVWEQLTPRVDQQLGGLIMWIPGGMIFLTALSVVFFRWQNAGGGDSAVPLTSVSHGR